MNFNVEINGIQVNAEYSTESIDNIFIPLLKKLTEMQKSLGRRILVMLAAPPGAGKSTLCQFLYHLSRQNPGLTPVTVIGMDGFHHYQDYLLSHTTIRDGQEIQMVKIKGAPITFDLPLLTERVKEVAAGAECGWPEYNRLTHNPKENAIKVAGDIVILEGNYLLLNQDGWDDLSDFADYTIKISADEKDLFNRLVDRKMKSGNDFATAKAFVEYSDLVNAKTSLQHSKTADLNLKMLTTGEYVLE